MQLRNEESYEAGYMNGWSDALEYIKSQLVEEDKRRLERYGN